jgi:hypothetical protein
VTTPNGPILFNADQGSDTQASGLGPPTAKYGSGASTTGSSAVVTGIDTTNVLPGDLLWVQSSSGRQFSIIATVDSSTQVTCDDNFDNTESNRNWAIGGKRATFDNTDSRRIFADIEVEKRTTIQTETDQTLTSAISATSQNVGVEGFIESADDTIKTITQTANTNHFAGGGGRLLFKKIKLDNSSSSTTSSIFRWDNGVGSLNVYAEECVFGDPVNTCGDMMNGGGVFASKTHLNNCVVQNMNNNYAMPNLAGPQVLTNNLFINNNICIGSPGVGGGTNSVFYGNIFANSSSGVRQSRTNTIYMRQNIFYNCVDGIYWDVESPQVLSDNLFVNCTTAINNNINTGNYARAYVPVYKNFFYNNVTKYANNSDDSPGRFGDVDLQADPFVDAANGDFNLNDANGGGAVLRNINYTIGE